MKRIFILLLAVVATSMSMWAQAYTDVSSFATLQSALSAGNNVRLTSDITCTEQITISSGTVIIDGNGKKLIGSSCRAFYVNSSAVLSMKDVTVTGFDLNAGGGAFRNNGTLVFENCIVSNNHTDGSNQGGGAIENGSGSKLYASNTTFTGNYSSEIGGAINNYGGSFYLYDCQFTDNYTTSSNARYGGAIGVNGGSEIRIVNCTFSGNKYGINSGASDLGIYSGPSDYTIAGCDGITIQSSSTLTTYPYGSGTVDFSDLNSILFTYTSSDTPIVYDITLADGSNSHGSVEITVGGAVVSQAMKNDEVTVSVTPDEGYSTKDVAVRAYTSWGSAGSPALRAPGLIDEIAVTKNAVNGTWTFTMPEVSVCVEVSYAKSLQDTWIQAIANQTYTGEAIEPTVIVQDGETTLMLGTDYTVAYSANTDAGSATVTITAVAGSDYSGTASTTFVINKADITAVNPPTAIELFYTGQAQALIDAGSVTGGEMQYSLDGETFSTTIPTATAVGDYTVYYKVVGDANHNDMPAQTLVATIARAENKLLAELYAALGDDVWTGYGAQTGVISYSRGDEPNEFRATFLGGTYTIDLSFDAFETAEKADNGDGSYTYTLVVRLPAETGMPTETLHITMKNGEITELDSENAGINMSKEGGEITSWSELQSALDNGGVIKLSQDITAGGEDAALTVPSDKTVVLELNGFTVNRGLMTAVANGSVIVNNGTLAIMDSHDSSTGTITGGNTTGNGGGILNNGTLTLYSGEITGNNATGNGGGVYNSVTNTDTEGFWMTGGLIDANTANSYPAIGGDVTFNNLAVVQTDADGTTVSVKTAKAGMATYSYIKPVMPNFDNFGLLTQLYAAITEAEDYYNSIKESNPDAAAPLLAVIQTATDVQSNPNATQEEILDAITTVVNAVEAAKADVALKRITISIPAKSYVSCVDADKRKIENAVAGVSLYSVKGVSDKEVTLTAAINVVAAEMPYLIYNNNNVEMTISIVVSTEDADDVEYDSEHFKGTLVDKTFTVEEMQAADHYILSNGKNFIWVKDPGTLAAGKCWIELVPTSALHARALDIVFDDEPTGISAVPAVEQLDANCYELGGRRVAQPTKGLFIVNGIKVVKK